jgi:hypothetical protein
MLTPDLRTILVITGNGLVFQASSQQGALRQVGILELGDSDFIRAGEATLSPDGRTVFLSVEDVSSLRGGGLPERLLLVDTDSWGVLGSAQPSDRLSWVDGDTSGNGYVLASDSKQPIIVDGGAVNADPSQVNLEGRPVQIVVVR